MRGHLLAGKAFEAKHLNWAREALGFALNAKLRAACKHQCNMSDSIRAIQEQVYPSSTSPALSASRARVTP